MTAQPDHLVIAAPNLDAGVAWVEKALGVTIPRRGGEHTAKGTHNVVMSLGPDFYLEILSLNPDSTERNPPRWTWLDDKPADFTPSLETWSSRCTDVRAALAASDIKPGNVESMSRGDMHWLITLADDGSLTPAKDGAFPFLIQWEQNPPHPVASTLPDLGCRLRSLAIRHPDAAEIQKSLGAIKLTDPRVSVSTEQGPRLTATIETPNGERTLETR